MAVAAASNNIKLSSRSEEKIQLKNSLNESNTDNASSSNNKKVEITRKLPQLQNCCKRDPIGYKSDYDAQVRRLKSECDIFILAGNTNSNNNSTSYKKSKNDLMELIQFAAAVSSSSYKGKESDDVANLLMSLLLGNSNITSEYVCLVGSSQKLSQDMIITSLQSITSSSQSLPREIRKTCLSSLILMRRKGAFDAIKLYDVAFRIMCTIQDKALKDFLQKQIVNDVKNLNKKHQHNRTNVQFQSFLHKIILSCSNEKYSLEDEGSILDIASRRAVQIITQLYRKKVWNDARTISILATGVTSSSLVVSGTAMRFFLNIEEKMDHDQKAMAEEAMEDVQKINFHRHSKKTRARARHVAQQVKERKKLQKAKEQDWENFERMILEDKGVTHTQKLYPAIELLHDAQSLAEKVLKRIKSSPVKLPFQLKILMINFVTRLVGNHELLLLPLYSLLQRYLNGYQRDVTAILAFSVQACHEGVPPEEVHGLLKTILNNFVSERCTEEQMAVGLNAIRAICARVPSVLVDEEQDVKAFVQDVISYAKHRDRSVSMAGRGFLNLIRELYPGLLSSKDRGLSGSGLYKNKVAPLKFGEMKVSYGVEGADLLVEYEARKKAVMESMKEVEEQVEEEVEEEDDGFIKMNQESSDNEEGEEDDSDDEECDDEELQEGENDDEELQEGENDDDDDEEAPELLDLDKQKSKDGKLIDLSAMSKEERNKFNQEISSSRIFSTSDFIKMRKLVARQESLKRDPRAAARLKRAQKQNSDFAPLSDDEDEDDDISSNDEASISDEEENLNIKGVVNPDDLRSFAEKKRTDRVERLTKTLNSKQNKFNGNVNRAGGSTNQEKNRKKAFVMTKFAASNSTVQNRNKKRSFGGSRKKRKGAGGKTQMGHLAKKRRRK